MSKSTFQKREKTTTVIVSKQEQNGLCLELIKLKDMIERKKKNKLENTLVRIINILEIFARITIAFQCNFVK